MSEAPWSREKPRELIWRDALRDAPNESGYYAITTDADPIHVHIGYYNADEFEWDFMPPVAAIEWVIEPVTMAVIDALKKVLDEKTVKKINAALGEIDVWSLEFVEEHILGKLESGYDTGANKIVSTWCELPDPGMCAGEDTGAEIVQLGAMEVAERMLPHLRQAIADVISAERFAKVAT